MKRITVTVDPDDYAAFDQMARHSEVTASWLTGEYTELSEMTGLRTFVSELAGHVAAEAARSSGAR